MKFMLEKDGGLIEGSLRTYLNSDTSKYIRNEVRKVLSGEEVNIPAEKGQTELLRYLCVNNGATTSGNCVHHINFNHYDFRADNICVIPNKCHSYLHSTLVSECIIEWLNKKGVKKYKDRKNLSDKDISRDDIGFIFDLYIDRAMVYINSNRIDKSFPRER